MGPGGQEDPGRKPKRRTGLCLFMLSRRWIKAVLAALVASGSL